jgi:hypothetical protein
MKMLPIAFEKEILPGSFGYSLCYLVDHEIDLRAFDNVYRNGGVGSGLAFSAKS